MGSQAEVRESHENDAPGRLVLADLNAAAYDVAAEWVREARTCKALGVDLAPAV
jgi:hypothetical protein